MDQEIESVTLDENLDAAPGAFTTKDTVTPIAEESNKNIESDKETGYKKNKIVKTKITDLAAKKMKDVHAPERKSFKRKAEHPPTSEMVIESIKALKKRNGATFEDIGKYATAKYRINIKTLKTHINKFLKRSVENGALVKTYGATGAEPRFKIKKTENNKKSSKNVLGREGKGKPVKRVPATKKQVKK